MFDRVTIRVSDREASERFYETVLRTIGIEKIYSDERFAEWDDFSLAGATGEKPITTRLHVGFVAPSRDHVESFWQAEIDSGYRDAGPPGVRPQYSEDYYGAFLRDPDGNSAEAVHGSFVREGPGGIDHLWMRVADLAAAKRFYEIVATHAGFYVRRDTPERARCAGDDRPGPSRSFRDRRRSTFTSRSRSRTTTPSMRSRTSSPRPGTETTAGRGSGRSTTRATTARTCSIPTGTTSSS